MKISKDTLAVIRNFASINANLLIEKGSVLRTINAQKNVLSDATVAEEFPKNFGIYDTNEFLGAIGLFTDPDIEFKDKFAVIKEGSSSIKFYAADSAVLTVPTKNITFPGTDVEFTLSAAALATVQKAASQLRAVDIAIVGDGKMLNIVVGDLKNPLANSFSIGIGETDKTFSANLKIENLKLMASDYVVSLSSKKISRFVSADGKVNVFVAMESSSEM